MTAMLINDSHVGVASHVHVWRCEGCRCIHVRAGEVLLTFTPVEFNAFTEAVNDCYWQQAILSLTDDEMTDLSDATLQRKTTN